MSSAGTVASLLALGFAIGMRHALDADHLAAVAALATRSRTVRHTVWQGVVWGTGHTLTLLFFGALILATHTVVPERLAQLLEFAVGLMLVLLGADVLRRVMRERRREALAREAVGPGHTHGDGFPLRALFVGMMHGMAGTAAIVLLSASAAGSVALGMAHIASFGVGSMIGMTGLSMLMAIPLRWSASHLTRLKDALHVIVGFATMALGALLMHETLS